MRPTFRTAHRTVRLLAAAAALITFATTARAQAAIPSISPYAAVGRSDTAIERHGRYGAGTHVVLGIIRGIPAARAAYRAEAMVGRFTALAPRGLLPGEPEQGEDETIVAVTANAQFGDREGQLRPYLVAGGGYAGQIGGLTMHGLGVNAGVGTQVVVGRFQLFAEVRAHNLLAFRLNGAERPLLYIPVTVGIIF